MNIKLTFEEAKLRFDNFKRSFTFAGPEEAIVAMDMFFRELEEVDAVYDSTYRRYLYERCKEAVESVKASIGTGQPELDEFETYEWYIDPVGVALARRRYTVDEYAYEDIGAYWPAYLCPADYTSEIIGSSKEREVDIKDFELQTEMEREEVLELLRFWPRHVYSGSLESPDNIRISYGALVYVQTRPGALVTCWPRSILTPCGANLF